MRKEHFITLTIIIINILIFIIETLLWWSQNTQVAYYFWALFTPVLPWEFRRIFTSIFLHFWIAHLWMNMYSLYNIWPIIEKIYGHRKYLIIYIWSWIIWNLTVQWSEIITGNYSLSAWASGSIFWILGALLARTLIQSKKLSKKINTNPIIASVICALAPWFFISWISLSAHLWGLIWWFILGYLTYIYEIKHSTH